MTRISKRLLWNINAPLGFCMKTVDFSARFALNETIAN